MTPAIWLAAIATLSLAVSIATFIYTWNTNRARASHQELEKVKREVDEVDKHLNRGLGETRDRLKAIETALLHLPSSNATHELALNLERMHGDMKELREALKGVQGQLETVNNHLLNEGRRS